MSRQDPERRMPGKLDVLLRDLHLLWCEDQEGCPADWNLADADPARAASYLSDALWAMKNSGTPKALEALQTIESFLELA